MEKILITTNEYKKKYLLEEQENNNLKNIKFYTKSEFFNSYYFSYDFKTIYYLMKKYNIPYSISKEYLNNMYYIEDKNYKSNKLNNLKDIKKDLINNNLLIYSNTFREYIKNKEIDIKNIYDLDLYQEKVINKKIEVDEAKLDFPVYEFNTIEEEVHFVCVEIRKLIDKGIPLSKIYLCNVDSNYYFILDKIFSYYNIPIEIPYKNSIYSTTIVNKYLKTGEIDLEDNNPINKKLCNILSNLIELEDDSIKKEILIEELKNTYISNTKYKNAVTIKDIYDTPFQETDHVYVLGFNQDALPRIYKDIDYISDKDREEVDLYTTDYLNKREKRVVAYLLSRIPNITVSYKLSSPFQKYYPSSMIGDYKLEVKRIDVLDKEYSNLYNKIRLGEGLDEYYLYGEKNKNIDNYLAKYDIGYSTYDSSFTGINYDTYLNNLSYPLRLSYTSLNSYNECRFKYYIQYVLKLGEYEQTFAAIIGSLYHEILSMYKNNPDIDYLWNHYLEEKDLSLKDTVLLVRIRRDLDKLISILKEQDKYTKFDSEYYEKELKVKVRDDILVEFIGYVDKIMTYKKVSDTYFSIVDYKSGFIDTHIEPMKYGLHMQLPIYLYLINKSKVFDSPIFTGIYYQNILFNYPTWSKSLDKDIKDNFKLKGYSTDNIDNLELFDITYKDSELIKSMKYSDEKGFDRFSKILDDEMVYKIVDYTDKVINNTTDNIIKGDFKINPKIYNKENISCKYCDYKDICFVSDSDVEYLDKVEDFDFLGGEE